MHANAELIHHFYSAFQRRDGEAMAACYHPQARFSDPVFPALQGSEVGDMWRMLTRRAADLALSFDQVEADERAGRAHWVARYTFGATGRAVVNDIQAAFVFRDGRILEHTDRFDLWRWSRQALGAQGWLLGWSPLMHNAVRAQAAKGLAAFRSKAV
ncbi:MAG: nuclear transport factor 2 family protein [Burkholderiales bacterium]|nr:nuclear transport factor 2 family protein [Burkholderiales bacterium]